MKNNADGLILGKTKENNLVIQHEKSKISNRNIFVVGGPGSFKTQSYVLPNVINNRSSSIVVTDPKGEIYEMTNAIKQKQGYKTVVVNFKDFLLSSRYNPLLYIRKSSDTNIIANAVVSAKNDPKRKDFWFNAQMSLLNSLIKYVYFEYDPKSRNLEGILDFLEEFDPRYNEDGVSELDEQFERLPDGHEAKRSYYLGFRQAQSEARPNIVISLLTTLLDYIDNDVSDFTNTNDFFFEELGQSKVCLYILISPLDRTWDGLINLYFQQMFTELFLLGDKNNAKLPVPCVMLLDEFVNLGYFATYENFLATCRGYRISVSTILQSIPQLQELYGDKKAKAIIGNHSIRICLGGVEETTAEYFSRLIGDTTIRVNTGSQSQSKVSSKGNQSSGSKSEQYSYQKRRLITEGEVINLQDKENGRRSIVVIEGKPFMLRKTPQFELFDDLLSEHNVSQQDYVSEQSEFAIEYIFNLEKEFKEKKQAVLDSLKSKTKIKEDNQESLEIPLPENEVVPLHDQNSSFEHEEEQKEIEQKIDEEIDSEDLMNDIMQSFDGLSFEEEITQPKIKSENTTTNSNSDDDFPF